MGCRIVRQPICFFLSHPGALHQGSRGLILSCCLRLKEDSMTLPCSSLTCAARRLRAGIGLCVIGAFLLPVEAAGQAAVGGLVGNVRHG